MLANFRKQIHFLFSDAKTFAASVVKQVTFAAYAAGYHVLLQVSVVRFAAVLAASVAVKEKPLRVITALQGFLHGSQNRSW